MRTIHLEIEELVGYGLAGPEGDRVTKVGSAKVGRKELDPGISVAPEPATEAAEQGAIRR
jgi:hypothetical protein